MNGHGGNQAGRQTGQGSKSRRGTGGGRRWDGEIENGDGKEDRRGDDRMVRRQCEGGKE